MMTPKIKNDRKYKKITHKNFLWYLLERTIDPLEPFPLLLPIGTSFLPQARQNPSGNLNLPEG